MAKNLKQVVTLSQAIGLFELDTNNDYMPIAGASQQFDTDDNNDLMPPLPEGIEDEQFELDVNSDIMPKDL